MGVPLLYLVPSRRAKVVQGSNYKGLKRFLIDINFFQKAPNLHLVSWGLPAFKTVLALSMGHVEGDNISGLCNLGTFFLSKQKLILF